MSDELSWTPERARMDPRQFAMGRIGVLRLGPAVRVSAFGDIHLALHPDFDAVVEVERYAVLADRVNDTDPSLMTDIGRMVGVRHRHLAALEGAGVFEGVPYVLRRHRLGRTLDQVLGPHLPADVGVGILYSVVEALAFLAEEGPMPGACAFGGLHASDVFLGYDGGVHLLGAGLQRVRGDGDPQTRDLVAVRRLASALANMGGGASSLVGLAEGAETMAALQSSVRRFDREACGHRSERLAMFLRRSCAPQVAQARAFFGLETVH